MILIGEFENRRLAKLQLVAVLEDVMAEALAIAEGPVATSEVFDDDLTRFEANSAVMAGNAIIDEADIGVDGAAENGQIVLNLVHLADVAAGNYDQVRTITRGFFVIRQLWF